MTKERKKYCVQPAALVDLGRYGTREEKIQALKEALHELCQNIAAFATHYPGQIEIRHGLYINTTVLIVTTPEIAAEMGKVAGWFGKVEEVRTLHPELGASPIGPPKRRRPSRPPPGARTP